jgi:hypothetical protein
MPSPETQARLQRLDRCASAVQNSTESDACKFEINLQVTSYTNVLIEADKAPHLSASLTPAIEQIDNFCSLVESTFPSEAA